MRMSNAHRRVSMTCRRERVCSRDRVGRRGSQLHPGSPRGSVSSRRGSARASGQRRVAVYPQRAYAFSVHLAVNVLGARAITLQALAKPAPDVVCVGMLSMGTGTADLARLLDGPAMT